MGRSRVAVIAFALAGLVLVAGVTYLASRLVSQPIGLASEPATLGRSLAPVTGTPTSTTPHTPSRTVTTTTSAPTTTTTTSTTLSVPTTPTTTTPTTTTPTTTSTTPDGDDHGGGGGGAGGGDRDDD